MKSFKSQILLMFDVSESLSTSRRKALFEFDLNEMEIGILKNQFPPSLISQICIFTTSLVPISLPLSLMMLLH